MRMLIFNEAGDSVIAFRGSLRFVPNTITVSNSKCVNSLNLRSVSNVPSKKRGYSTPGSIPDSVSSMTTYRWPSQTITSFVTISTANDRTSIAIYIKSKLTARLKCYLPRGWSGSLEFFLAEPLAIGHAACFFSRFARKGGFLSLQRPFLIPALAASRPAVCTQACQGLRACNVYTIEQRLSNDRLGQVVLLFLASKLLHRFNILSALAR